MNEPRTWKGSLKPNVLMYACIVFLLAFVRFIFSRAGTAG